MAVLSAQHRGGSHPSDERPEQREATAYRNILACGNASVLTRSMGIVWQTNDMIFGGLLNDAFAGYHPHASRFNATVFFGDAYTQVRVMWGEGAWPRVQSS